MVTKSIVVDSNVHGGHRGRMRSKLLSHGQKIFDTYELLEMLLYYAIPYKDTNPIAKNLLAKFGGLDGVFLAEKDELTSVPGIGNATADFLRSIAKLEAFLDVPIGSRVRCDFSDYHAVGRYLVDHFSENEGVSVVAMFLDNNMRLLSIEKMYDVDYSSGGVKGGKFLDAAIRRSASVVITAHCHPHGPFYPTPGDRETDRIVSEALDMAGILHAEHFIICGNKYAGISSVKNFTAKFSQFPAIDSFINSKNVSSSAFKCGDTEEVFSDVHEENGCDELADKYISSVFSAAFPGCADFMSRTFEKYGTIEDAMTAPIFELVDLNGESYACFVKLVAYVFSRRVTDMYKLNGKVVYGASEMGSYLKALFLGQSSEIAYLLCFDEDGRFIDSVIIGEGTVNSANVLPRKALEAAIEKTAKRVSLAHNHPYGKPEASSDDIKMTSVLDAAFSACGIQLDGHYIVAGQRCSMISVKTN